MYVDMLSDFLEQEFEHITTVATPLFSTTILTHELFSLEVEVSDQTIEIYNIVVHELEYGHGSAVVSLICDFAHEENLQVMACNVLGHAEDWWLKQGFERVDDSNDFVYTAHKPVDEDELIDTLDDTIPDVSNVAPSLLEEWMSLFEDDLVATYS